MTSALPFIGSGIDHPLKHQHPQAWNILASAMRVKTYHKNETVLHHGDPAGAMWIILSGWVKLTRQTPNGQETIIGLCTQGDMFGEAALFANSKYPYHAEVLGEAAELASIPSDTVRSLITQDQNLSTSLLSLFYKQLGQAELKLEHMNTLTAAQRLGCFFLRLRHNHPHKKLTLQIPIEKSVLAAYLGMKPETLSRSQQQLKAVGAEVKGHTVTIEDFTLLNEFVCESCSQSGGCAAEED